MEPVVMLSNAEHTDIVDIIVTQLKEHSSHTPKPSTDLENSTNMNWMHIYEWLSKLFPSPYLTKYLDEKDLNDENDPIWLNGKIAFFMAIRNHSVTV
jgi:hypothetical protein